MEQYGRKATKLVLASLEANFMHKEPVDLAAVTIEHVMPQEISPNWRSMLGDQCDDVHSELLHTFGNLTLTGYNSELGNRSFEEKRKELQNSHIELNRWICQQAIWNASTIKERAAELAKVASEVWLGPESVSA
jgi:hypothetical protein